MLIAIVLARPLAEARELVDDPAAFTREMTRILRDKQTHPLIAQMMKPAASSDPPPPLLLPVVLVAVESLTMPHTSSSSEPHEVMQSPQVYHPCS